MTTEIVLPNAADSFAHLCWSRSGVTPMKKTQGRQALNEVLVASSFDFDLAVLWQRDSTS